MLVAARLGIGTPAFSLGGVLRSAHRHTVFSIQRVTCVPDLLGLSWFRHETTRTRNGSVSRETAVSVARVKPSCQLVTVVSVGLTPTATTAARILRQFSLLGNLTTHVKRSRLLILVV